MSETVQVLVVIFGVFGYVGALWILLSDWIG